MRCFIEIGAHVGGVFPSEVIQKDEQYVGTVAGRRKEADRAAKARQNYAK